VIINFTTYILIIQDVRTGYFLGLFTSGVLTIGNGLIHIFGWIKTRSFRDSLGAGFFTGIPLGILGVIVLVQLVRAL